VVQPLSDDRNRLALSIEQSGLLAGPVGLLLGSKIRRFIAIESEGLRAAAETASGSDTHP
jgi:hypothetical protein